MNVEKMRAQLAEIYPGKWARELPNRQVVAIYKDMERKGRLVKKSQKSSWPSVPASSKQEEYVQLSIWDFMK